MTKQNKNRKEQATLEEMVGSGSQDMLAILCKGKRSSHRITACAVQHQDQHLPLCLSGSGVKDIKGKLVSIRYPDIANLEQAAVSVDGLDDMLCHKLSAHACLMPDIRIVIPEVCAPPSQGGNAAPPKQSSPTDELKSRFHQRLPYYNCRFYYPVQQ